MSNTRVQSSLLARQSATLQKSSAHATGLLRGQGVRVVAPAGPASSIPYADHLPGLPFDRPLAQRRIRREQKPGLAAPKKSSQYLASTGNALATRLQALNILRSGKPAPPASSRREIVNRHLATETALRALEPDIDDVFQLALLCPLRQAPSSPPEFFELLERASPEELREMAISLSEADVQQRPAENLQRRLNLVRHDRRELVGFLRETLGLTHGQERRHEAGKVESLAERLQDAGSEEEAAEILGEFQDGQASPELVRAARRASRKPEQLARLLRQSQQAAPKAGTDLAALRQALRDDLHEQELSQGGTIAASLHAEEFARQAGSPEEANAFLDSFTELLFEAGNFGDAATSLIKRFGLDKLPATVGLMQDALRPMQEMLQGLKQELGAELRELGPGFDPARLGTVVRSLSHLHVLATLTEKVGHFTRSMETMARAAGIPDTPLDASILLSGLIDIVNGSRISSGRFERLLQELSIEDNAARIMLLQGVKQLLRALPDKAYAEIKNLQMHLEAAQELLDRMIEREEETAGSGGIGQ